MSSGVRNSLRWLALVLLLAACAPSQVGPGSSPGQPAEARTTTPKRITVGVAGIGVLSSFASQGGPGISGGLQELLNAGTAYIDGQENPQAQLAEAVPSIENGLWKLFPDGRMETTWRLKPGIKWHDGTPFTTDDLLFTATVDGDKAVPHKFNSVAFAAIDGFQALDDRTIVVRWKGPYVDADKMFSSAFVMPMPKHILEQAYLADKSSFPEHAYWTTDFVGTGPYRLREVVLSSHVLLDANPDYVLGRPRIDTIEVRGLPDPTTRGTHFLAGAVELGFGNILSPEQAVEIGERWRDGRIEYGAGSWVRAMPQLLDPTPAIVGNVQFRRAMYHAIDRQAMVDTLMNGNSSVAHTMLAPNQPQYREIEGRIRRYEYDPRKAGQMIEELGYSRGPGGVFRDANGQRLSVELRTVARSDLGFNTMQVTADGWRTIGVNVEQLMVPAQRAADNEYRATFPAFEVIVGSPFDVAGLLRQHSSSQKLPQTNFVGSSGPRYINPDYDALIERYYVTIPIQERIQVMGQIISHYADNVVEMPLYFVPDTIPVASRISGVVLATAPRGSMMGNAHLWDVKS